MELVAQRTLDFGPVLKRYSLEDFLDKFKAAHLVVSGLRDLDPIAQISVTVFIFRNFKADGIKNVFMHKVIYDQISILSDQSLKCW